MVACIRRCWRLWRDAGGWRRGGSAVQALDGRWARTLRQKEHVAPGDMQVIEACVVKLR